MQMDSGAVYAIWILLFIKTKQDNQKTYLCVCLCLTSQSKPSRFGRSFFSVLQQGNKNWRLVRSAKEKREELKKQLQDCKLLPRASNQRLLCFKFFVLSYFIKISVVFWSLLTESCFGSKHLFFFVYVGIFERISCASLLFFALLLPPFVSLSLLLHIILPSSAQTLFSSQAKQILSEKLEFCSEEFRITHKKVTMRSLCFASLLLTLILWCTILFLLLTFNLLIQTLFYFTAGN